jgi:hypothetical protein
MAATLIADEMAFAIPPRIVTNGIRNLIRNLGLTGIKFLKRAILCHIEADFQIFVGTKSEEQAITG